MNEYALIGNPVAHSRSKEYFNRRFLEEGIRATYISVALSSIKDFPQFLEEHPNLRGINVTSPYKQAIIPYLEELDEEARELGAVNTIILERKEGNSPSLKGYNTDVIGLLRSLTPLVRLEGHKALVFGTGGASQAVGRVLQKLSIPATFVSRSENERDDMLTYKDLCEEVIKKHSLLINATPIGMTPNEETILDLPYEGITGQHICYDLIYSPLETGFLKIAREQGATTMNGLEMLRFQAEENWRLWTPDFEWINQER